MLSLFSWGANSHGQLGCGFESEQCEKPEEIKCHPFGSLDNIKSIKGGGAHVFVLDKNGIAFACGWNHKGQLGTGNQKDLSSFVQINAEYFKNNPIAKVACGWDSSAAIDSNGSLYVWGSNAFGQLGFDKKAVPFTTNPIELTLPANEKVQDVCFGLRYICILTDQKNVYLAGRVKFSDQCVVVKHNNIEFFKLKSNLEGIRCIASGSNHLVYSCGSKKVIGVGDNKYKQCLERSFTEDVLHLECGWTHNGVLTADDTVWLWGRNTYGQLGSSDTSSTDLVQLKCKRVKKIYLGSEHGLAVTKDGTIFTWGWNEHGNCGNGNVHNVYRPIQVDLPGKCVVSGTGAGFCYAMISR